MKENFGKSLNMIVIVELISSISFYVSFLCPVLYLLLTWQSHRNIIIFLEVWCIFIYHIYKINLSIINELLALMWKKCWQVKWYLFSGYGQQNGGVTCQLYNSHPTRPLKVIYMETVPWYLRMYFHTLTLHNNGTKVPIGN